MSAPASYESSPYGYGESPRRPLAGRPPELLALQREVEDFLFYEADLLDQWRYEEWLQNTTEDIHYWVPIRRNVRYGDWERERSAAHRELAWIDDNRTTLELRVKQLDTGMHWAEEPRSRVSHIVTNIRIVDVQPSLSEPDEITVRSRFLVYRNHQEDEESTLIGKREDVLRRVDGELRLARRSAFIDQSVLLVQNLTILL